MTDIVERATIDIVDNAEYIHGYPVELVEELIAEVEKLRDMVARLGYQEKTLTKENAELKETADHWTRQYRREESEWNERREEIASLKAQLAELEKKVDELEETLIKQQNHYNTHNSHYLRKIKNQRKQLKEYETCAERLRDKRIAFWTAVREALK